MSSSSLHGLLRAYVCIIQFFLKKFLKQYEQTTSKKPIRACSHKKALGPRKARQQPRVKGIQSLCSLSRRIKCLSTENSIIIMSKFLQ